MHDQPAFVAATDGHAAAPEPVPNARQSEDGGMALVKAAVESANDAVIITEANLDLPGPRIEYVNVAFTRMTGYDTEEIVGKTPRILQGARPSARSSAAYATTFPAARASTARRSTTARTAASTSWNGASRPCATRRARSRSGWPSSAT